MSEVLLAFITKDRWPTAVVEQGTWMTSPYICGACRIVCIPALMRRLKPSWQSSIHALEELLASHGSAFKLPMPNA